MTKSILDMIFCGACNAAVARSLNEMNYVVYTYGWDEIHNGHYYRYDDDSKEWYLDDYFLEIVPVKDYDYEFHYWHSVDAAVVATLKRMLR